MEKEKIPFGCKTKEEFSVLEKILISGGTGPFNINQIIDMIRAYEIYKRSILRASEELGYGKSTISKYWRRAGFEIRKLGGIDLSLDKIQEINDAYEIYAGNALRAAENIGYCGATIIRYWRRAGFKIRKAGNERGYKYKKRAIYEKYKQLIEQGYSQNEISRKLERSISAVREYLNSHPELKKIYEEN